MPEHPDGLLPLHRTSARVVLVDPAGRTLLFHGGDPARPELGRWWFTPGGGLDPGEDLEQAARREVFEETGFRLGPLLDLRHHGTARFSFAGYLVTQEEHFFTAAVPEATVDTGGWTELERRSVSGHRWWSAAELATTSQRYFPAELPALLAVAIEALGSLSDKD